MVIRWLDESGSLGTPPQSCFEKPGFTECFQSSLKQAIAECESQPAAVRGDCVGYYADIFAYKNCRGICGDLSQPLLPASMTQPFPSSGVTKAAPATSQARRTPPPSTTESKSNVGVIVGVVVVAAIGAYFLLK